MRKLDLPAALEVTSPAFADQGWMPRRHTGFGEDVSPELRLANLPPETVSLAVVMNDLDVPFLREYTHWLLWNLPPAAVIPEHIPAGARLPALGDAVQGVGYGVHCYRGPKIPPFGPNTHRYVFSVYALDARLAVEPAAKRAALLSAMEGHVLAWGKLTGKYQR